MRLRELFRPGGALSAVVGILILMLSFQVGVADEVALGRIEGTALLPGTGAPLPNAQVTVRLPAPILDSGRTHFYTRTDAQGKFRLLNVPAGVCFVEVAGKAHSGKAVATIEAAKTNVVAVELSASEYETRLHASSRVFMPAEKPKFEVTGLSTQDVLEVSVRRLSESSIQMEKGISELARTIVWGARGANPKHQTELVVQDVRQIRARDAEGIYVEQVELSPLPPGVYLISAADGRDKDYTCITVTEIAMVTKVDGESVTAFVTDVATGRSVSGAAIQLSDEQGTRRAPATDADGISTWPRRSSQDYGEVLITAALGDSRAFAGSWAPPGSSDENYKLWLRTDRPIYRPGDTVKFQGIARKVTGSEFAPGVAGTATVTLVDLNMEEDIDRVEVPVSAAGVFHGEIQFTDDENAGPTAVKVQFRGAEETRYISVSAYRKPSVEFKVEPVKETFINGETARFKLSGTYFTGEPVEYAKVQVYVRRTPWETWNTWAYNEEDFTEYVMDLEAETNENGEAFVDVPASKYRSSGPGRDTTLIVEASVEVAGQWLSADNSALIAQGEFAMTLDTDPYLVEPQSPAKVLLQGVNHSDGLPAAGKSVDITVLRHEWRAGKSETLRLAVLKATLDAAGRASVEWAPPREGYYELRATARDQHGNEVQAMGWIDAYADLGEWGSRRGDLDVALDKENYSAGDTAKALIRTSKPGGAALVTIEADTVLQRQVVDLTDGVATVTFENLGQYSPNVFVEVAYIREKRFMLASARLNVDAKNRELDVVVTAEKAEVKPGEPITYRVKTTDRDGAPVPARLCFGLVDEAIYSLREDSNDPLSEFYPSRWGSQVSTSHSFPEIYLDAEDKSPVEIDYRTDFRDTAAWIPDIVTDQSGQASVTVRLPDNLTSWRATVTAFTSDTRIGKGKGNVVARKDLMARLSVPEFLVQRDDRTVTGTVTNGTDRAIEVSARLDVVGVTLAGSPVQKVRLDGKSTKQVQWTISAPRVGEASFKLAAWTQDGVTDGLELKAPVYPHGVKSTQTAAGAATQPALITMRVQPGENRGYLKVGASTTIVGPILEAMPYLVDYPYGCVEQTMSRFLPALLVGRLLKQTGYPLPEVAARIPDVTKASLRRLASLQSYDGGWGWWAGEGDPEMTAYVLEGLWRAKQAEVDVPEGMLSQALDFAERTLKVKREPGVLRARLATLAAAVLLHKTDAAAMEEIEWMRSTMPLTTYELSRLVIAFDAVATRESEQEADRARFHRDSAFTEMIGRARIGDTTVSWPEEVMAGAMQMMPDPTAAALEAAALIQRESTLCERMLRYLIPIRRGRAWRSTRETASVLVGTAAFLAKTQELTSEAGYRVKVNGKTVLEIPPGEPAKDAKVDLSVLIPGENSVRIEPIGGLVYYSIELVQTPSTGEMKPETSSPGLQIERSYRKIAYRRLEDGSKVRDSRRPASLQFAAGDTFRCIVTVRTDKPLNYVLIEDPIPSNCRIVDIEDAGEGGWWRWFTKATFLDDKAVMFQERMESGEHTFEYVVRAEAPGSCLALPTVLTEMYQPTTRATTGPALMKVTP